MIELERERLIDARASRCNDGPGWLRLESHFQNGQIGDDWHSGHCRHFILSLYREIFPETFAELLHN